MIIALLTIYILGLILVGPVFGHSERGSWNLPQAMIATAIWPVVLVVGLWEMRK